MTCTVVLGTQWGDEGKGKITDILTGSSDAVVRYQGGNNAGHTIVVADRTMKLHIVPSGVIHPGKIAVIGDGCVVDPWVLLKEFDYLEDLGIGTDNVYLSDRAHLIMPYHRLLDGIQESERSGGGKVGTTGRGIGPCYMDRAGRFGIRAGDLAHPDIVKERVNSALMSLKKRSAAAGNDPLMDAGSIVSDLLSINERLSPHIRDSVTLLNGLVREGKSILLEGAQGQMLDIDRGTYPFVTSSSCTAGNASAGTGIGPRHIDRIYGVVKAYTTRVGEGPFPTELYGEDEERMRDLGGEFGTTTGRPRRCGWLDLVVVRSAVAWNTIDTLAVTKLDVLCSFDRIRVCTHYKLDGRKVEYFPSHIRDLARCKPVYVEMEGWGRLDWSDGISDRVMDYIRLIEEGAIARVGIVSYGPGREQTIFR